MDAGVEVHPPGTGPASGVSSSGPVVVSLYDQPQDAYGSLPVASCTPQQGECVLCVLLILNVYRNVFVGEHIWMQKHHMLL